MYIIYVGIYTVGLRSPPPQPQHLGMPICIDTIYEVSYMSIVSGLWLEAIVWVR